MLDNKNSSPLLPVAYGLGALAAAALHNVFITYYVHLFLKTYSLSSGWFYLGESLFMIWNSLNDPWFGWLIEGQSSDKVKLRMNLVLYGGIAWSFGFLVLFFPWSDEPAENAVLTGLHFTISLLIYDGLLSLVTLSHSSLLPELSSSTEVRAKCNMYSSVFSSIGSASVFFSHLSWDADNVEPFQFFCITLAVVSAASFTLSAVLMKRFVQPRLVDVTDFSERSRPTEESKQHGGVRLRTKAEKATTGEVLSDDHDLLKEPPASSRSSKLSLRTFARQVLQHRNFWLYTVVNLTQVANCHFNSNFMSIFLDYFIAERFSSVVQSTIVCAAATAPHLVVVALTPVVSKRGVYFVMHALFVVKLVLGCVALFFFRGYVPLIMLYILLNKVFSEAICRHGGLVVADLVDEDRVLHGRPEPVSSLIYGINALFTKPGQTIAPVFGWAAINSMHTTEPGEKFSLESAPVESMFFLLCAVPILCSVIQLIIWPYFTLRGPVLASIKQKVTVKYDV